MLYANWTKVREIQTHGIFVKHFNNGTKSNAYQACARAWLLLRLEDKTPEEIPPNSNYALRIKWLVLFCLRIKRLYINSA